VIRATEKVSQLEAQLTTAEKDRDEAREQLQELRQRAPASTSMQCCGQCQQLGDASTAPKGNSRFASVF